jgi:hypothetical protein
MKLNSPNIIRRMRWAGLVTCTGQTRDICSVFVGKSEGKIPLGRPRWEDNIRTNLWEIRVGGVDWMYLAPDRNQWQDLMNTVIKLRVP